MDWAKERYGEEEMWSFILAFDGLWMHEDTKRKKLFSDAGRNVSKELFDTASKHPKG